MKFRPELSLVIPAYGEAEILKTTLPQFLDFVGHQNELIVVDDGSSDSTAEVVLAIEHDSVSLIRHNRNRGKGAAVRTGMLAANGEIRAFCDADLPYGVEGIERVVGGLGQADVAIGTRLWRHDPISAHPIRALTGHIFSLIVREVAISGYRDTQCGLKAFTASAAAQLFNQSKIDGFGFDVELLCLAATAGLEVVEVEVELSASSRGRKSTVRLIPDAFQMIRDVIRIRKLLVNRARDGAGTGKFQS